MSFKVFVGFTEPHRSPQKSNQSTVTSSSCKMIPNVKTKPASIHRAPPMVPNIEKNAGATHTVTSLTKNRKSTWTF